MTTEIQLHPSNKSGLPSKESYIITRGDTSFLRVLGADPQWELMTATASEDHAQFTVCRYRLRLIEAAFRAGIEFNSGPRGKKDRAGREYVSIGVFNRLPDQSHEDLSEALEGFARRFFEIYDECNNLNSSGPNEMSELYEAISPDDTGDAVYLSDGVWLSSNGVLHDQGK